MLCLKSASTGQRKHSSLPSQATTSITPPLFQFPSQTPANGLFHMILSCSVPNFPVVSSPAPRHNNLEALKSAEDLTPFQRWPPYTLASILTICSKLLQYNYSKLWWQAARLQQYQETQIHWPSPLVIEITKKPCKTATICYPPPSTQAVLPINKTSLNPLPTIPLPSTYNSLSFSHMFLGLCLGAPLPKDGDGRK